MLILSQTTHFEHENGQNMLIPPKNPPCKDSVVFQFVCLGRNLQFKDHPNLRFIF